HGAGTCDPVAGCSSPALTGTACNADNDACTTDLCQAGTCVAGAPLTCSADLCHIAGVCDAVAGGCPTPVAKSCAYGTSCSLNDGNCHTTCPTASYAKTYPVASIAGIALDGAGNQYFSASLFNTVDFGGGATATSAGSADLALVKLDPATGLPVWVKSFGDSQDQVAVGAAVSHSGHVGAIGNFTGSLTVGNSISNAGSVAIDFVVGTDNSGTGLWAKSVNTQLGALLAMAGNPARDEFVACGYAAGTVTDMGFTGTHGTDGLEDILIAKVNSATGATIWARQIGSAGTQLCSAIAMDATGNVFATGTYNGAPDLGTGALPTLGSTVQAVWVAKFDGATGATLITKAYGNIGKQAARAIALDSTGNVAITGNLKNSINFVVATLTSVGSTDGYLVKFDSTLTPVWAKSWGNNLAQESHGVAFNSVGDLVVIGSMLGTATFGTTVLTTTGTVATDLYWAKFAADGSNVCAAIYGDAGNQSGDIVAISSLATGAQKDMVNMVGFSNGTTTFASGISITTTVPNGFVLQMNP
ncbi:MAG TPA: hypothetical protein VF518_13235, partial [Polyangia bacterium]